MAEYSRIAKGHFTSTGLAQVVNLPFQPDRVEMINYTLANTNATSQNVVRAYWDVSMGQGQAVIEGYNATPALIYDVVSTGGISTFAAGQLLQYGPSYFHNSVASADFSISQSATIPEITTTTPHGLATGNVIVFENLYQTPTTGMQQMAGIPFTVTVIDATHFTVNWNNTGSTYAVFASNTSTGNVGSFKQVLYPYLYCPEQAVIALVTTSMGVTTFTTTAAHNFEIGQEIAFRIPPIWGSVELNSLPNPPIPGSPIYYYVTAFTQNTFTVANLPTFTAFNSNFNGGAVLPTGAFSYAQAVPVGDVNTGGVSYSGGNLYPSPLVYPGYGTTRVPTINGPAIKGAFVNNTSQGFVIGSGAGRVLTTADLVGASGNVIYWAAYLSDLAVN